MKAASIQFLSCLLLMSFSGAAKAQAPIAGQPYQVPPGYEAYGAGTVITYAGFNYVVQGNGTMILNANNQSSDAGTTVSQGPAAGQPYQVPTGYEAYGVGTLITYAGYNYVIQGNGTMILSADSRPSNPAQAYQVPAGYEGYGPGTLITYAGFNYVIQGNGTMTMASGGQSVAPYQTVQQAQFVYQQPQGNYWQPQFNYQQSYYQQPQFGYEQPQYGYQQPQYTYQQPQNYYQPGTMAGMTGGGFGGIGGTGGFGGAGVTGGGGQTRGGSNVAITVDPRTGKRTYHQVNPGSQGQSRGGFGQSGGSGQIRGQRRGR